MASSRMQATVLIIAASVFLTEACNSGIFGSRCQFKCHCENNGCDSNGECTNGRGCADGWFGPLCQYQDIAYHTRTISTSQGHDGRVVTDGDDDSCLKNINYVIVDLWSGARLNWLQLKGEDIGDVSIQYKSVRSGSGFPRTCQDMRTVRNGNNLIDVFCQTDVNAEVFNVSWTGVSTLCTLHVSGGRNVAVNEPATQSSTKSFIQVGLAEASRAVDGNTDTNLYHKSCAHTENNTLPYWALHLSTPQHVNRFVVTNRLDVGESFRPDCCPEKLKGFNLKAFDVNGRQLIDFTDQLTKPQVIYNISSPDYLNVSTVNISVLNTEHVLVICEVELFGYDICPSGKYGPECMFTCHCLDATEACHVESGSCRSGCPSGYQGPDCQLDCRPGQTLPAGCTEHPCKNCVNLECDSVTRKCLKGCVDKTSTSPECITAEPSTCTQQVPACNGSFFGSSCQFMCHCQNNICVDKGECKYGTSCELGWFGIGCQFQDIAGLATLTTFPKHNPTLMTDGDDATCILELENIQVNLPQAYPFTWMRIIALEPDYHIAAEIKFADGDTGKEITCLNPIADILEKRTTDFYCDLNSTIRSINITLKEPRSICSLLINGGINIGLKQPTQLSTNNGESIYTVDGQLSRNGGKCAQTDSQDKAPSWTMTLPHPYRVFRYVVHSGINSLGERQGFTLSSYTSSGTQVFSSTVRSILDSNGVTTIPVGDFTQLISSIKIEPSTDSSTPVLNLCEVEVFGENPCPSGMFGPDCDRRCNCADPNDVCLVSSGGCVNGCAPGFFGEGCDTRCLQGSFGVDCRTQCSDACLNHLCDKVTGACI